VMPEPLGDVVGCVDPLPEPFRKEAEECDLSYTDAINRVRMPISIVRVIPIDEEPAPDHDEKNREIDPMHPSDRKWMLAIETKPSGRRCSFLHGCKSTRDIENAMPDR
jgi:hypothetical protein